MNSQQILMLMPFLNLKQTNFSLNDKTRLLPTLLSYPQELTFKFTNATIYFHFVLLKINYLELIAVSSFSCNPTSDPVPALICD